ncbi:hypothetical protein CJP74_02555 [Psittacicella melopsittaci]|uniref:Type I restriction modification DNA specificity domain-containing protein n=1 Tax=Psittacicella melopsittaci TaxID=2028576 RepID=A0A3A1Y772_9GAMM|nr:restriction endonuclease subunit S [Psittacicella melopsittaci]RIY33156.1 hypothetical protein CJP74_02555 [Psittacicella melopsittaci]
MEELKSSTPTHPAVQVKVWNTFTPPINNNLFKESTLNAPKSSNNKVASVRPVARKNRDQPRLRFPEFSGKWSTSTLSKFLELPIQEKVDVTSIDQLLTLRLHLKGLALCKDVNLKLGATEYYKRTAGQLIYGKQNFLNKAIAIIPKEFDGKCSSKDVPSFNIKYGDSNFIYYSITRDSYIKSKDMYAKGTGSKRVSEKSILTFEIIFPSLEEQQKIGNFFKDIDDKSRNLEKSLNGFISLKKSLLQQLYTDKIYPRLRFPEYTKALEKVELKSFVKKNSKKNKDLSVTYVESVSNKFGFISQEDLFNNRSIASKELSNYTIIEEHGFAYNPSRINVGSIAYKHKGEPTSIVSPLYVCFSLNEKKVNNEYFINWIRTSYFDSQRRVLNAGSVRDSLVFVSFVELQIRLPNLEEQNKIAKLLIEVNKLISTYEKTIESHKNLKQALLQRMFI